MEISLGGPVGFLHVHELVTMRFGCKILDSEGHFVCGGVTFAFQGKIISKGVLSLCLGWNLGVMIGLVDPIRS